MFHAIRKPGSLYTNQGKLGEDIPVGAGVSEIALGENGRKDSRSVVRKFMRKLMK